MDSLRNKLIHLLESINHLYHSLTVLPFNYNDLLTRYNLILSSLTQLSLLLSSHATPDIRKDKWAASKLVPTEAVESAKEYIIATLLRTKQVSPLSPRPHHFYTHPLSTDTASRATTPFSHRKASRSRLRPRPLDVQRSHTASYCAYSTDQNRAGRRRVGLEGEGRRSRRGQRGGRRNDTETRAGGRAGCRREKLDAGGARQVSEDWSSTVVVIIARIVLRSFRPSPSFPAVISHPHFNTRNNAMLDRWRAQGTCAGSDRTRQVGKLSFLRF